MPDSLTLEALYHLNKEAKRHAARADAAYHQGRKRVAHDHSCKKTALYELKERVLAQLHPDADRIERHRIDESEYYCLYFDEWSFHAPVDALDIDPGRVAVERELTDFDPGNRPEKSSLTTRQALDYFAREWQLNANAFLPTNDPTPATIATTTASLGWPHLDAYASTPH